MEGYFNVFHLIALAVLVLLSMLFMLISRGEKDPRLFKIYLAINVAVTLIFGYFFMLVVDKYTKKAVLIELTGHRVLRNEMIVFKGSLRNTGEFSIASFKPSGLSLFSRGDERSNVAEVTASVAKNIAPKQIRNFSVSMPYPSYFTNTQTITKLECR